MTHEAWVSRIVQAVHAANQGNPRSLHRLASLLEEQESPLPAEEQIPMMFGVIAPDMPAPQTQHPDEAE